MKEVRKNTLQKAISIYLLCSLMFFLVLYMFSGEFERKNVNVEVILSFCIIGIQSMVLIVCDKKKFSINKTFAFFTFFFFFIAPLMQYLTECYMWNYIIEEDVMLKGNWLLILFNFVYFITWKVHKTPNRKKIVLRNFADESLVIFTFISFGVGVVIIGFPDILYRETNSIGEVNAVTTIIDKFIRFVPVYALTIYMIKYDFKFKLKQGITFGIMTICILLLNFPTALTRYYIGVVYIGLILHYMKKRMSKRTFDYGMIVLFMILFPIFQIFKWYSFKDFFTGNFYFRDFSEVYNNADFDGYSMFLRILKYVESNSLTYGNQLLSVIFFLIPRAIWKSKPLPTGQMVAESQRAHFTNLSAPYIGEGYINFGIIGVILFATIFAIIAKELDTDYWRQKNEELSLINICYPYCIGFTIFLLRGSLQPVIVYMFSIFLPIILCAILYSVKDEKISVVKK